MKTKKQKKIELVAPAGTLSKLRVALKYGADAVYLSGKEFGLRKRAGNFTFDEISQGVSDAHASGRKVYLTLNIFAHNQHIEAMRKYCKNLKSTELDAVIVSDPGVFSIVREMMPDAKIHISTQANTTNSASVAFWEKLGADRVILARELSLKEITEITGNTSLDVETFVHGAMCISYSGRCLLSSYLANRGANLGDCAHPCRWEYRITEKKRPDEPLEIHEEDNYTYIMSSRDLCMIEHIAELAASGISAFKIEGRIKTEHYVASVTRIYREALDRYYDDPKEYKTDPAWIDELSRTTTKGFTTGFFFGNPLESGQIYGTHQSPTGQPFMGIVADTVRDNGFVGILSKNKMVTGMDVTCMSYRHADDRLIKILELRDEKGNMIEYSQPNQAVLAKLSEPVSANEIICRR